MPVCEEDVIEDIEDIVGEGDLIALERAAGRSNSVIKHVKRTAKKRNTGINGGKPISNEDSSPNTENATIIPGTQKIWVKTWGCAHNSSDSEYMAGQLAAYGYSLTGKAYHSQLFFRFHKTFIALIIFPYRC